MKSKELRELSQHELMERLDTERTNLVQMTVNHRVSPLDKPSQITAQRKLVARIHTVLREKELASSNQ